MHLMQLSPSGPDYDVQIYVIMMYGHTYINTKSIEKIARIIMCLLNKFFLSTNGGNHSNIGSNNNEST